jgi:hypothetical protein
MALSRPPGVSKRPTPRSAGHFEAQIAFEVFLVSWLNFNQLPNGRAEVRDAIVSVAAVDAHRRATLLELSFRF